MTRFQVLTVDLLFQCGCVVLSLLLIWFLIFTNFALLILLLFIIWQWLISPIIFGFSGLARNFITTRRVLSIGIWLAVCLIFIPFLFYENKIGQLWLGLFYAFYTISYFVITVLDFFKSARQRIS